MDICHYENFLEPRRQEISNFFWISKHWDPTIAFKQGSRRPTPASHKEAVLQSPRIQQLLNEFSNLSTSYQTMKVRTTKIHHETLSTTFKQIILIFVELSKQQNVPKSQLEKQIRIILDEIGYDRKMKVIRWLGLALTKICLKVLSGLYINTAKVQEIKSVMGNCPVIFVPSHRSYGDFILMAYLTFTYDVEIPAVAAGMDFHGMWGMGTVLRDTGAFFMRRSYNDDSLYWTTFEEYVYQLITKADVPIEFFLEGTRSRSNKSLPPKFGLLSMILKPLFLSQVPDILFVPISINYDRILEENLFTYELLGVPKPKETTSGFFKSLKIIKENFGDIFIHVDEAISARKYFDGKIQRTLHNIGPLHQQNITEEEKHLIPQLANEVVRRQQKNSVLTVFNLIALVLNNNFANQGVSFTMDELTKQVMWIKQILENLGCFIYTANLEKGIKDTFIVHSNLIRLDSENKVCLISNEVTQEKISPLKLKGHALSDKTMTYSVPFIMLQIYVNPSLQYFVDVAIIAIILNKRSSLLKGELFQTYYFLRSLFAKEFILFASLMEMEFESAVNNGINFDVIKCSDNGCHYQLGSNNKLTEFLLNALEPFTLSYFITFSVLQGASLLTDEKSILADVQQVVENAISINKEFIHPYCLNLDTVTNCLSTLCSMNIMKKSRRDNKNMYSIYSEKLREIRERFEIYIPDCHIKKTTFLNLTLQNKL